MNFTFTNQIPHSKLDELLEYLRGPRLYLAQADYPDHESWLHKAYGELSSNKKRAIVASHNGRVVGATIYQRHKEKPELLELKNFTVRPDYEGRYVGSFLLRNTEIEGLREFKDIIGITLDSKTNNHAFKHFVTKRHGYFIAHKTDLYSQGTGEDYIFQKNFGSKKT
jgi:ribosomal protein S18 acetylase RimI-like enzyme